MPALLVAEEKAAAPYTVGVAAFSGEGLSPDNSLFLSALPRLVLSGLSSLPPRFMAKDYQAELTTRQTATRLYEKGAELYARLDDLALRQLEPGVDPQDRQNRVAAAVAKALEARSALELSPKPDPIKNGAETLGQEVVLYGENLAGKLLPAVEAYAGISIKASKVDLLIHGRVKGLGSYVVVEVFVFDAALGRDLTSFRIYGDPADPEPLAQELSSRLARFIAGRDFARIQVQTKPDSAWIKAVGKDLYARKAVYYAFEEGELELEISAPGYIPARRSVHYKPGESITVNVELSPADLATILVDTKPQGLPIFLDGQPLGLSPLAVNLAAAHSIIATATPEGLSAETVVSSPGLSDLVLVPNSDSLGRAKRIESGRDHFYSALGLFVLSLPVASLAYGLNSMYYDAAYRSSDQDLARLYYLTGIGLGVSATLSAGLGINAVIRLVRYISSTD